MSILNDVYIQSRRDLVDAVEEVGFLPLFRNSIPGFSAEEHTAPDVLWSDDGLWEWKGPTIQETRCAYGKFFDKKATFISQRWFLDYANYRRDGYDFDARYDEGLAPHRDKVLYDLIERQGPIVSLQLKDMGGYGKGGVKGFDTTIYRLQVQGYVIISNFVYRVGKNGQKKGWGLAEYSTPELFMGEAFTESVYSHEPEESRTRIADHLRVLLPQDWEKAEAKLLS